MPKKKTQTEVLNEFYEAHGNYYDYSLVEYKNSSTKVKIICPKHGEFEILFGHHKNGVGCRKCYFESQRISKLEFIRRSQVEFGDRYDYSLIQDFSDQEQEVEIICREHKKLFRQNFRNHMRGHTGCPICQSRKREHPSLPLSINTHREGVIKIGTA